MKHLSYFGDFLFHAEFTNGRSIEWASGTSFSKVKKRFKNFCQNSEISIGVLYCGDLPILATGSPYFVYSIANECNYNVILDYCRLKKEDFAK